MLLRKNYTLVFIFLLFAPGLAIRAKAQQSVLTSGIWSKLAVTSHGVYKIDYNLLKKAGIDPAKTDPRNIRIYGNEGGMLPQPNSTARPVDLTELAIYVKGESDGLFNKEDYILFYAQGPDIARYDATRDIFACEHNLYADKNFYFITAGTDKGKRIASRENISGSFPVVSTFSDYVYHEADSYNELESGREWYGEKFDATVEYNFPLNIPGIVENSTIKLVSHVMAQSFSGSTFKVFFNNTLVASQYVNLIGNGQYSVKGSVKKDTIDGLNATTVGATAQATQNIKYQYTKASSGRSVGYLNLFLISCTRTLALYDDQTIFRSPGSLNQAISTFQLRQTDANTTLWDITDPYNPTLQASHLAGDVTSFTVDTNVLREFVAFSKTIQAPEYIGTVPNQNLHGASTPDMLIVTNPAFKEGATRLAQYRAQHNNWSVIVATTEEVYNEFSSGRQDVTAIRDFAKYLNDKSPGTLKALMLVGRGSYDYKDRISNNTNFVPTYESRNSLSPLETYSSDDYFGFLENSEGNWGEEIAEYHTLDISVGRLTVKTAEELNNVIDKIVYYETNPASLEQWRKQIAFVADDGDLNEHQGQADSLARFVENNRPDFNAKKIYVDQYQQILMPNGENVPDANENILEAINRGSLIVNYSGHGAEKLWAQERIFDDFAIEALANKNYPLFVTATCEFGRQDDPAQISGAELLLLRKKGGAIGLVSTGRPVSSSTNFALNKAFYTALLQGAGQLLTLGDLFKATKNNSIAGIANRNFSLLGDPSLTLAVPQLKIKITSITSGALTDTLKALSRVRVQGEVVYENLEKATDFSGMLQAVLYDKRASFTTLGNENAAFSYKEWYNAIFRGKATVTNGEFEFEFIVPKNIAYQFGDGKLSLYAYNKEDLIDAAGADLDFVIGESEKNPATDITPPAIGVFIGDTTFTNGGIASPNTTLVARLSDASGINISAYGIGNNIIGILDDTTTIILNDYYEADADDFTKGTISYPLNELAVGKHTLTLKAWDTYNNPGEATIEFIVTDGDHIQIEFCGNYPNPFRERTTLFFTHNRSGDDLQVMISIIDLTGQTLATQELTVFSSPYRVELPELSFQGETGKKLGRGLYLAKIAVRSLSDHSKNEQVAKLIRLN